MSRVLLLVCAVVMLFAAGISGASAKTKGKKKMLLVAHRGESYIAPENTLAAFNQAWKTSVPGVELDCYLTKDNKIICIHDGNTKRTSGVDMVVKNSDSQDMRKLDVGKWKGDKYTGEKMPFISEALATIPKGGVLFCEIKCGPEIMPFLRDELDKSGKRSQVTIISFGLDVCAAAKKMMPDLQVYYLSSPGKDAEGKQKPYGVNIIMACLENYLDGLNIDYSKVTIEYVDQVKAAGLKMYVWTCDDANEAKRLVEAGVDGITSNRAAWLAQQLGK